MKYNNRSEKGQFQKKVHKKAPTWSIHGVDGKFQPIAESFCTNNFNNLELFNDLIIIAGFRLKKNYKFKNYGLY